MGKYREWLKDLAVSEKLLRLVFQHGFNFFGGSSHDICWGYSIGMTIEGERPRIKPACT